MSDNSQTTSNWASLPYHRRWLLDQADGLFDFFQYKAVNPKGGFFDLDESGAPIGGVNPTRGIHSSTRMVHCFSIAYLLGRPGAGEMIDHGMRHLWEHHRDSQHGGYFWQVNDDGPVDANKQGYGHAFVLLAASSAKVAGHPLADKMLSDITEVLETRFWEAQHGAIAEEFARDWSPIDGGSYRGQNSNMHLTEALMAAYEATGEKSYLEKAESVADLVIRRCAGSVGFRVAEHFDRNWVIDKNYYHPDEMFRPAGTTPGHSLEWSRLLLQLWALGGKTQAWMPDAAKSLFVQAMSLGWDKAKGGFFYTLDWDDKPAKTNKLWWPMCEAAGAAHFLNEHLPTDSFYEDSYRLIWGTIANRFIDHRHGGWHEELTEDLVPAHTLFPGKGDLYHALQACLIPLFPATGSLTNVIVGAEGRI
ncbi:mannose-6-phosphate isomerase [Neorhizobium sp. SOG26]|uniref:AGE family epimerase/isomerase n=1 Tax=Neorhizobium sp. SOG26 TaxID=2060726 RepID=UPI000E56B805|nr:AGE family epimerase/isomerase [Neorhizobium sp. SOG26]AXV15753.1 mannose-6-phosphate isomerase [Neorhizobium sp. SOG26]